jgi:hypothetical protein
MLKGVTIMNGVKNFLLNRLTETHSDILTILEGIDLELPVYTDSDWRIRDILGHIATWDREVTKSLRAFLDGTEYFIPDIDEDETEFNEQAVIEQRTLSTQQIVAEWGQAREDFKAALSDIPTEKFPGDLLYPWGDERGSIARLVEYMLEHDEEHRDEIVKAVQAQYEE